MAFPGFNRPKNFQDLPKTDHFNYPAPQRQDLMSLSTLQPEKDLVQTHTTKMATKRIQS